MNSKVLVKKNVQRRVRKNPNGLARNQEMSHVQCDLRRFGLVKPNSVLLTLRWDFNKVFFQAISPNASISFNANGIYDVDPAFASTAVAGFTEWIALYSNYRVIRNRVRGHVANLEAQPMQVAWIYSPGVITSPNGFNHTMYGNRRVKETLLAAKGGLDMMAVNAECDLVAIFGNDYVYGDVNFVGGGTSNPAAIASFAISTYSTVNNQTVGVAFTGFMEFDVEFFYTSIMTV